jgi:hypothetical protein
MQVLAYCIQMCQEGSGKALWIRRRCNNVARSPPGCRKSRASMCGSRKSIGALQYRRLKMVAALRQRGVLLAMMGGRIRGPYPRRPAGFRADIKFQL